MKYKSKGDFSRGGRMFAQGEIYDLTKEEIEGVEDRFEAMKEPKAKPKAK